MRLRHLLLACFGIVAATCTASAQFYVGVNATIGATLIDAGFRAIDPVSLPRTATSWNATGSLAIGGSASIMLPLANDALVGIEVGVRAFSIDGTATESTVVLVDGLPTTATMVHGMSSDVTALTALVILRYPVLTNVYIELGTGMGTAISSTARQTERITSPTSTTFLDGSRDRVVVDGGNGTASLGAVVVPSVVWQTSITNAMHLELGIGLAAHLGPLAKSSDLLAYIPHARAGLSFQLGERDPEDVMP